MTGLDLKNRTVKNLDIGKNTVNSLNVANGSLQKIDFAPGQLETGPAGPQGPAVRPGARRLRLRAARHARSLRRVLTRARSVALPSHPGPSGAWPTVPVDGSDAAAQRG